MINGLFFASGGGSGASVNLGLKARRVLLERCENRQFGNCYRVRLILRFLQKSLLLQRDYSSNSSFANKATSP